MAETSAPLVLVTGVSGYIAAWVAYGALQKGYRVRGTVRNLSNETKVKPLRNLCPGSKYEIELVEADLTSDAGWAEAVSGCQYILHVASPFPLDEPKDENEVIGPAVDGTLRVLRAAAEQPSPPKRVVVTSSVVAVSYGHRKDSYTDDDWTVIDSKQYPVTAYSKSKTLAEKAAWEFISNLPEDKKFELCTVNPGFVMGPMLTTATCSSADLLRKLVMAELPALPDLHFGVVSVYDVARCHLLAMTNPSAAGKRFICVSSEMSMRTMGAIVAAEFKPHGYSCTTLSVPSALLKFLAFCGDPSAKAIAPTLGKVDQFVPKNAKEILGMELKSDSTLPIQMVYAAINAGLIPDKSKDHVLSTNYVRQEFDLSMVEMST